MSVYARHLVVNSELVKEYALHVTYGWYVYLNTFWKIKTDHKCVLKCCCWLWGLVWERVRGMSDGHFHLIEELIIGRRIHMDIIYNIVLIFYIMSNCCCRPHLPPRPLIDLLLFYSKELGEFYQIVFLLSLQQDLRHHLRELLSIWMASDHCIIFTRWQRRAANHDSDIDILVH